MCACVNRFSDCSSTRVIQYNKEPVHLNNKSVMAARESNNEETSSTNNNESAEIFRLNNVQVVPSTDSVQFEQPLELTPTFRSKDSSSKGLKEPRSEKLIFEEHLVPNEVPNERIQQPVSSESADNERFSRATVSTGIAESERHSLNTLSLSSINEERREYSLAATERIQQPVSSVIAENERFSRVTVSTGIAESDRHSLATLPPSSSNSGQVLNHSM